MDTIHTLLTFALQNIVLVIVGIFFLAAVLAVVVNPRKTRRTWVYNRYTDTWSQVESK